MNRFFRWLKQVFSKGAVYCEHCEHCIPDDGKSDSIFYLSNGMMCKANPITVDCSDVDKFVKKNRDIKIIKTYKRCERLRMTESIPATYSRICWQYDKKVFDK